MSEHGEHSMATAAADPVIEADRVSMTYPGPPPVTVLHPTSLAVYPGDQVAIVGASGSGKSTLLSVLGTLESPTTGEVRVAGKSLSGLGERERSAVRSAQIGFVFQQFHLMPTVSAVENVATGLLYTGTDRAEREARAVDALHRVGLGHRLRNRPTQMSGGEQQRVAIARALVRDPLVLFADEPTGALDSRNGQAVLELLLEIGDAGTALVVVTHDTDMAERFARSVRLSDGRIIDKQEGRAA